MPTVSLKPSPRPFRPRTLGQAFRRGTRVAVTALLLSAAGVSAGGAATGPAIHPSNWPARAGVAPADPAVEKRIGELLDRMTLEEKIGQLLQPDISSATPDDVRRYHLGSVLAGGFAAPNGDVRSPPAMWLELTDAYFRASLDTSGLTHEAIPIIFGIDAVHGHARMPGGTVFPHNVGLGATHDPALIERIGRATAEEVAATGIDWTFAPTVAVVRDPRWGRSYESYSEDPGLVADYARAMVFGLQGRPGTADFMAPGRTLASVKHFLGDGSTIRGRDQFDSRISVAELRDVHAPAYPAALSAGALIVMASYNGWQGTKMHDNPDLLTGVLKERWAFPGFVVGDWNGHEEIPGCTKWSCPDVLRAGLDMYMAPDSWKQLYTNLLAQVHDGTLAVSRVDDAVRRVLRVKATAGILARKAPTERPETANLSVIGSAEHRAVARDAVRKSLVLLKNDRQLLPLNPHSRILVAGPGADDIGMQCGGWTIDWQGAHNRNRDFPGGTSIYAGIRQAVEAAGGVVTLSTDGHYDTRPDVAVVVYGETPYSEFEGDRETLEFDAGTHQDLKLLQRLKKDGIPVVSVFISGRVLWVNRELNASDAFVAAWLPGSEGAGIADVLLRTADGKIAHDFTGRLPFSWPATPWPATFANNGAVSGALLPRGYGLVAADVRTMGALPEAVPGTAGGPPRTLFAAGHVTAPWSAYVADAGAEVRLTMDAQASPGGVVTAALEAPLLKGRWTGTGRGEFRIGGRMADFRAAAASGLDVVASVRVQQAASAPVGVGIRCDAPYGTIEPTDPAAPKTAWPRCGTKDGALLDLSRQFSRAAAGRWQTVRVPLRCLSDQGADLSSVVAPFVIDTSGKLDISLQGVHLEQGPATGPCPALLDLARARQ